MIPLIAIMDSIGLSIAYSVAYWVAAVVAIVVLNRKVPGLLTMNSARLFGKGLLVAVIVTTIGFAVDLAVQGHVGPVLQLVIVAAVTGPVFVALVLWLKPHGFEELNDSIKRRFSRTEV